MGTERNYGMLPDEFLRDPDCFVRRLEQEATAIE
jgi:hypothetical protein